MNLCKNFNQVPLSNFYTACDFPRLLFPSLPSFSSSLPFSTFLTNASTSPVSNMAPHLLALFLSIFYFLAFILHFSLYSCIFLCLLSSSSCSHSSLSPYDTFATKNRNIITSNFQHSPHSPSFPLSSSLLLYCCSHFLLPSLPPPSFALGQCL